MIRGTTKIRKVCMLLYALHKMVRAVVTARKINPPHKGRFQVRINTRVRAMEGMLWIRKPASLCQMLSFPSKASRKTGL